MERRIAEKILLIVSAASFFASIFGWYGSTLPEYYESKTSLIIKPPQISGKVIASLTEEELEQKLVKMNQDVLSSISLEPMINKYKLFELEKSKLMPTESIIEMMRKYISIKIEKEKDRVTGFLITYRDTNPEKARIVTAELAEKYVNQPISCNLGVDKKTDLLIKQAENHLKKIEKKRSQINSKDIEIKYQTAKDNLRWLKADLENSSQNSVGETIRIVYAADLPDSPISKPWLSLTFVGAGFGFFIGLIVLELSQLANIVRLRFAVI